MSYTDARERAGVLECSATPTRLLLDESKPLRDAVEGLAPWVLEVSNRVAEGRAPIPPTCLPFQKENFFRLPTSTRSFYYSPTPLLAGPAASSQNRGVLAWKGLELQAADFGSFLESKRMETMGRHFDRFALVEHKAPCVLTLREAEEEAAQAFDVQCRYLATYGELAPMPVPVATLRFSDEVVNGAIERFRKVMTREAWERIEPTVSRGLGAFVYYFPTVPIRASHFAAFLPTPFPARMAAMKGVVNPEHLLGRWARLFGRLLQMGFLPATLGSLHIGNCFQSQNATIDGGVVDLDSIERVEALAEKDVFYALEYALNALFQTSYEVLVKFPAWEEPPSEIWQGQPPWKGFLWTYLVQRVRQTLMEPSPAGPLAPSIERYFATELSFEELTRRIEGFFPPPGWYESGQRATSELFREAPRILSRVLG